MVEFLALAAHKGFGPVAFADTLHLDTPDKHFAGCPEVGMFAVPAAEAVVAFQEPVALVQVVRVQVVRVALLAVLRELTAQEPVAPVLVALVPVVLVRAFPHQHHYCFAGCYFLHS